MNPDDLVGMAPEDRRRALLGDANHLAIQRKREAAARALLVTSKAAAQTVRTQWRPVSDKVRGPFDAPEPDPRYALVGFGPPDETTAALAASNPDAVYMDLSTSIIYAQEGTP